MASQPFESLLPDLLPAAERLVVAAHRHRYGGPDWTEPKAYHWLRYEDPDPVARLADGVRRLDPLWVDEEALSRLEKLANQPPG